MSTGDRSQDPDPAQSSIPISPADNPVDEAAQQIKRSEKPGGDTDTHTGEPQKPPSHFQRFMHKHFPEAKPHDRWTLVFTAVIAVSTATYTLFAGWTLWEIYQGGTDTHTLAEAATRAAKATEDSVTQVRDNAHLDQRAWISVKNVKLTTPYSVTKGGVITVALENSGKTPALDVSITKTAFGYSDTSIMAPPDKIISMTVGPSATGDTMFIGVPPAKPSATVYLRFVIEYWDIFQKRGSDPPHSTIFCGYYPTSQPPFFFNTSGCSTMN